MSDALRRVGSGAYLPADDPDDEDIVQLRLDGIAAPEVAARLDIPVSRVWSAVRRAARDGRIERRGQAPPPLLQRLRMACERGSGCTLSRTDVLELMRRLT